MENLLEKLLAAAGKEDRADLEALNRACAQARENLAAGGTDAIAHHRSALSARDHLVDKLAGRYFKPAETGPAEKSWRNRKEAWQWLRKSGYKISRGKFYNDYNALGRLQGDGSILETDLNAFVLATGLELADDAAGPSSVELAKLQKQKLEGEIKIQDRKIAEREIKIRQLKKELIGRREVFMEIAGHAAILSAAVDHLLTELVPEIIEVADGDISRMAEILTLAENRKTAVFNKLAGLELEVIVR